MTIKELWMVIVRRWKLVVLLPVVCALACGCYLLVAKGGDPSYTASAYITANSQTSGVVGIVNAQARALVEGVEEPEMTVSASVESGTSTVTVTAKGPNADECIDTVNSVAEYANNAAAEAYENFENPYSGTVQRAVEAEESITTSGGLKYLAVAILTGLFIAVCIVVVLDMRDRPVKTPEGVQELTELPVLEIFPAKSGERLLANVRFAAGGEGGGGARELKSVLVVPTGNSEAAEVACDLLKGAAAAESGTTLEVGKAAPLAEGMAGAYASQDAGAVVVTARQWADSLPQLESTVAELRLAGANLVGIVFAKDKLA